MTENTIIVGPGGGSGKTVHAKALAQQHVADGGRALVLSTHPREWTPSGAVTVTGDSDTAREIVTAVLDYRIGLREHGLADGTEFAPLLLVVDAADKLAGADRDDPIASPLWPVVERIIETGADAAVSVVLATQHLDRFVPRRVVDGSDVLVTSYKAVPSWALLHPLGYAAERARQMIVGGSDAVLIHRGGGNVVALNGKDATTAA
ncbi:ATP-binding protein [Mycobacteroides abscessus]|uniref:ATP-binding protein n=1 Tax=Mycobacteroides abscessus TaxID=36809 RepID=UPI00092973AF|nr:ATP-binding protein [Mycobacteroides abscessus]SHX64619.1 Uncharacterised protein [Mycobacteroides abscessus subsp. abscessus]SHZ18357.1 Uncharacterised protein [Mycobacteroides abscessus subsp. abscessus]SIB50863.1 Uncharacterised protein [Mycobacteroides abscessus subsp. abscessus]SIF18838.1 Uncharacterised protein [Mycobacteroides abscessus subsp. abscessus]SKI48359.1 Uncharacterised protein [Mycobacteroides abscessus subsp. abscessus]